MAPVMIARKVISFRRFHITGTQGPFADEKVNFGRKGPSLRLSKRFYQITINIWDMIKLS